MTRAVLELRAVTKSYGALRPLRIEHLAVSSGQHVAIVGLDRPCTEAFVNLATGASLPDTGDVTLFGRTTGAIESGQEWLSTVEAFGIVSERAVLLERLSVLQNLGLPFSLEIDPMSDGVRASATALAREVGLGDELLNRAVAEISAGDLLRVRLARALALDPAIVLLEHPSARLSPGEVAPLGRAVQDVIARRRVAAITLTADRSFARAAAGEVLTLQPATGRLQSARRWF